MGKINKIIQDIISAVTGTLLVALTTIIFVEVISRYCFHETHNWAVKITPWMAIWIGCIGAAVLLNSGDHIRIDVLYNKFGRRGRYIATIISHIATFILAIFLTWGGILSVKMMLETGVAVTTVFRIPYGIVNLAVPIGFFLVAAFSLILLVNAIISGHGIEIATTEENKTAAEETKKN